MKKALLVLFIIIPVSSRPYAKVLGAASIGAASLYTVYRWLTKPGNFKPTIENLNTVTLRPKEIIPHGKSGISIDQLVRTIYNDGISFEKTIVSHKNNHYDAHAGITIDHKDELVCVFSRGYAKVETLDSPQIKDFYDLTQFGGGAKGAFIQYVDNIAPKVPIIGFDYPDDRRNFSMGGHREVACLDVVIKHIKEKNPHANILLIADCRGACVGLRYAANDKKNHISAMVLMSPFSSACELSDHIAHNYLSFLPGNKFLLRNFFKLYYPCFKPKEHDNIYDSFTTISPKIPVFIAHRKKDSLISPESIQRLKEAFQKTGNPHVQFFEIHDESAPHSKMTHLKSLQDKLVAFYKKHNLLKGTQYEFNYSESS